jgi:Lysophospholipase L1 and related esterases
MKIVCLGDSLTAGMDRNDPSHWINILQKEAVHTYVNKGICGDTSGGMLARFYRDVVEEEARCVILMGGENDFIMGADGGVVQSNLMAMVHQAFFFQIVPVIGIPIILDPAIVRKDWAAFTNFGEIVQKTKEYRAWIYRFAETFHVEVLDFQKAFERSVVGEWKDYFSDGVHPNEKGNRIMADLILNAGM